MAETPALTSRISDGIMRYRGMLLPIFALSLILVILIPLPTPIMDFLLATNIALSAVVLLTVIYMNGPLEFSAFPSLLLAMTLFRLVLNTATTRLILTNATQGEAAAGKVIQVFGQFVASGSLMVAVIIFAIVVIIQFVVITKGATRIAEVAARFTLDGMPGKQMAIDADLNAGILSEEEAKNRRKEISREADFYGAMDGASKFVRGDAVAGIIITFVNILGGIYVGMVEEGFSFGETLTVFTILTIGDGLVSQIPAFIISIAAAMIVTRSASQTNLGEELLTQLTGQPVSLGLAAGFLGFLAFTGLPKIPLIILGGSCSAVAFFVKKSRVAADRAVKEKKIQKPKPESIEKLLAPDPMELELGFGLIKMVDRKQGGDLLDRVTNMRKQIAQEFGIVVPPIRIRDNIQLEPNRYVVKLRGMEIGGGEALPGHLLAIDSGMVSEKIDGTPTTDPAFGLPALWIEEANRHGAERRNYTVVEPSSVLITHLTELTKQHADELVTRAEMNRLLENLKERSAKLIEELIPNVLKPGDVQKVVQNLLRERVPVRDLEVIVETIGDWAPRTKDAEILTEYARNALARTICQQHRSKSGKVHCITLDPKLEENIHAALDRSEQGTRLALNMNAQRSIVAAIREEVERAMPHSEGDTPVILCDPRIRMWVRRMIEDSAPTVAVLSYNEIVRGVPVESHGMVAPPNPKQES
jgi:flagellar biosynthesis protein FlhA